MRSSDGDYRMYERLRVSTREKAYSSRWSYVGCRGTLLDADPHVHDAPVVGGTEEGWILVRLDRAFS